LLVSPFWFGFVCGGERVSTQPINDERLATIRKRSAEGRTVRLSDVDYLLAALVAVRAERDGFKAKLERLDRIYEGLRTDANDGEFALWSEDDLVAELHSIRAAVSSPGEETP
jgi:hypothetical protein